MDASAARQVSASIATIEMIRAHFPALERVHNGYPVAYFDGPGGTQVPREVVEAAADYLYHHNANTHWAYPTSAETDEAIEYSRQALADFLNAEPAEIAFGANMTTLTFHLARALGRQWGPGDEIVVTELDHHGNVAPWQALERERGVTVKMAKMIPETGQLDWEELQSKITPKTRLVAMGAASNALGTISDVRQAGQLAHTAGALMFVDAVHSAPHVLTDVRALDCDFLACSAYKFYGPHIGVLYGKKDLLQAADFPKLIPAPDSAPERAETGTQNHEGIAGASAAVNFLAGLGEGTTRRLRLAATFGALHDSHRKLLNQLWQGFTSIDGVTIYGPPPDTQRTPTVSFTVRNVPSSKVAAKLAEGGVFVSHGDFYAWTIIQRFGLGEEGLVRAGCACYTTEQEIARLVEGVRAVASGQ